MIGTITHILAKAGYKAMNGPLADERRRLAGAVSPAAYVSYDPRLLAGAGWYGYRIALKGGDRSMLERARYMLEQQYTIRDSYEYYADGVYTFGVLLRQRVPHYGIGGGGAIPEPDALNFYMPDGGTITLTKNGSPTVVELEYSIDGGATWQVWEEVGNVRSLTLAAGQKMYVRNTSETSTGFSTGIQNSYTFSFSAVATAGGRLSSLKSKYGTTVHDEWDFANLFKNSFVKDASNLLFESYTSGYMCHSMFRNCHDLIYPPKLPNCPALSGSYAYMFYNCYNMLIIGDLEMSSLGALSLYQFLYGCSNINRIYLTATSIQSNSIDNWLYGVSPTGDFYCPAELTIPTGASGIPSGWTRHDI